MIAAVGPVTAPLQGGTTKRAYGFGPEWRRESQPVISAIGQEGSRSRVNCASKVSTWEASSTSLLVRSKATISPLPASMPICNLRQARRLPAMLLKQPFASAAQFQSGAVDDQVKIAGLVSPRRFRRQSTRPPAQRRMIRDGQVDLQHSHDRTNQPFALAKRQSKHRSQSQRGFDGKVRTMTLTAGVVRCCAFRPAIASGVTRLLGFRDCGSKHHIRASF